MMLDNKSYEEIFLDSENYGVIDIDIDKCKEIDWDTDAWKTDTQKRCRRHPDRRYCTN